MSNRTPVLRRPAGLRRLAVTLAVALVASGCGGRREVDTDPPPDRNVPVELTVSNQHWLDVIIFVMHDGETTRVGTVTAVSTAMFTLPPWMIGQSRTIQLIGDPMGADGYIRTEMLTIQPGQTVEWRLESQLARSSVSVY